MISARCAVEAAAGYAEMKTSHAKSPGWEQVSHTGNIWSGKKTGTMKKVPVIDIGKCTDCESCLELCPEVFRRNSETGYIEVTDLDEYPVDLVDQIISICPADCISWDKM